jgi:glycosyltransferase involved in cell wall biosynthesis
MPTQSPFITIVIPFHNEKGNLHQLLPVLQLQIEQLPHSFEVLLVDDVSTDGSLEFVENFCNKKDGWRVLALLERGGQTGCFREAFKEARGEFILRMDADLQDDPWDLRLFVESLEEGAELVMGLRECRKHRKLFRLASMLYDMLILILFDTPLHSNSGSYVAFRADLVKSIPWRKNDHRFLPLIAIRRGARNVREVIVRHGERVYGVSKYSPMAKIIKGIPEVILFLIRLRMSLYDR